MTSAQPKIPIPSSILVIGDHLSTSSVACCLARCGSHVTIFTSMITENEKEVYNFLRQIQNYDGDQIDSNRITITDKWPESIFDLVFLLGEDQDMKDTLIQKLENEQSEKCIIAVSCDSIPLGDIQKRAMRPQQIIGVNWCVPAHTTFFLEIVKSPITEDQVSKKIKSLAVSYWQKDPYIIEGQLGIRSKLLAALIREAFHIVEEGYASAKDVDRACRNDGGTYLPFAGNFRYMDLMGTYAYAVVMQDLNQELSSKQAFPEFFESMIEENKLGQKTGEGFYNYEQPKDHLNNFNAFSLEIRDLMLKYNKPSIRIIIEKPSKN